MRTTFIKNLTKIAAENKNIFLLTGDLGFSVLEEFAAKFPERFFNVGVAEQAAVGIAAGLALAGKQPFFYSIIPFVTMRPFEQIRNDICYQNLNVKLVGVGAGLSYGKYGPTHHAVTDIAVMRALPNMIVIAPGDPIEIKLALKKIIEHPGPVYLRIGKKGEPIIHKQEFDFQIGKGIILSDGSDITIFATGNMLETAKNVADKLNEQGISVRLVSMPTIKPIDSELIVESANCTKILFSLEEHSVIGGFGSAIAEVLVGLDKRPPLKILGIKDKFVKEVGSQNYLRDLHELSEKKVTARIKEEYSKVI